MKTWFWILGWSLSILTITGNGFIIFLVWSKRQLRTKTNALIVSLAVADLCVGISAVPFLYVCKKTTVCNHLHFLSAYGVRIFFAYASVTNLCSLVLDRYIAVLKPLKYLTFMSRRRVIQMILVSWAIPFTLCVGIVFKSATVLKVLTCLILFLEVFPSLMLIFCFVSMLQVVFKHNRATRFLSKQLRFNHQVFFKTQEKSAMIMMGIVISLFLVCYAIFLRCTLIYLFNIPSSCGDTDYKIPILVCNSAINPLAYYFFKRDINKEVKRRICCATSTQRNRISILFKENSFSLAIVKRSS
ncbi:trace amine-associated receptor 2-like [Stylophora pistillata]|uniref:trace amine-associated receptor 2-like n=1 Tax=Stylophora pistillata TaxID=50429 RepID=UPI000C03FADA|nr:trace amine-associated receptor 2-like [Stylophora pistillata]